MIAVIQNYRNSKIQIKEIPIQEIQKILIEEIQKYKWQKCRNTDYGITEINKCSPILQKLTIFHVFNMNYGWIWLMGEIYV